MQAAADLEPETSGGRSALEAYEKSVKNAMQANERDKLLDLVSALQHYDIATAAAAEFLEQNPDGEAQLQPELSWVRQQSSELQAKLAVHAAITIQRRCVPWRTEASPSLCEHCFAFRHNLIRHAACERVAHVYFGLASHVQVPSLDLA